MNCPNCTEALEDKGIVYGPDWAIVEFGEDPIQDINRLRVRLDYSIWECPHCHCIVLRCEE